MSSVQTISGMPPEKRSLSIGFIPLADAAPIIMAKEKGFFARHGLDVSLSRERSWARIRDKVAFGELDGAHMLAPMVVASALGLEKGIEPFQTSFALNLNGNAITVSEALYQAMWAADPQAMRERPVSARALRAVIAERIERGAPPLTFAMVFPFSSHNYQLRYWLAAEGIDPDRDIRLVVVPPPSVMDEMAAGALDGYCVGEPWNSLAVEAGVGRTLITSQEIWSMAPEKVFGVLSSWAGEYPDTHFAVLSALLETCRWLEGTLAREETASVLSATDYLGVPAARILPALTGNRRRMAGDIVMDMPDFGIFHRYGANFPWRSHAGWFVTQMYRWGQIEETVDIHAAAGRAYRPALYRAVAAAAGIACPSIDEKMEGAHPHPWLLAEASAPIAFAANTFFDGRAFDPRDPVSYIEGFERHRLRCDATALRDANTS